MKIIKVFNNNVICIITEDKNEVILTGAGIGFQKKIGDTVDDTKIEKRYYLEGIEKNKLYQLFQRTPSEYFKVSQAIIDKAVSKLNRKLGDQILISLTDHISVALQRQNLGVVLPNLILPEIKNLYLEEYKIGLWGIQYIKDVLGIELPDDEAGYIALHIVNASINSSSFTTMNIIRFISGVIEIVKNCFKIDFDENSLDYTRLITHLKFFAHRIFNQHQKDVEIDEDMNLLMTEFLSKKSQNIVACINKINEFIEKEFEYRPTQKELMYLMIHIYMIVR